jgi:hypothetical protein
MAEFSTEWNRQAWQNLLKKVWLKKDCFANDDDDDDLPQQWKEFIFVPTYYFLYQNAM